MGRVRKPKLDATELTDKAKELKEFLEDRLVNQHRAVEAIVDAYNRFLSPLYSNDTPIVTALFAGPSGVGKTHIVELLAEFFYDDRKAFTKIECANYRQRYETSKLLGAAPGYIGYDEDAMLSQSVIDKYALENIEDTEDYERLLFENSELRELEHALDQIDKMLEGSDQLPPQQKMALRQQRKQVQSRKREILADLVSRENLISIILFDEIEKAHHALHNVLLEITDKARTTMSDGEVTNFSNSFIILTSNAGSEEITDELKGATLGFHSDDDSEYPVYEVAMQELRKVFPTEFLGRLEDSIVVFRHLDDDQLREVMEIHLREFRDRLAKEFPLEVVVSNWVKNYILNKSTDHPEYGARLIRHKVQKYLIDPIMRLINSGQVDKGDKIYVQKASNQEDIEFRKRVEEED